MGVRELRILVDETAGDHEMGGHDLGEVFGQPAQLRANRPVQLTGVDILRDGWLAGFGGEAGSGRFAVLSALASALVAGAVIPRARPVRSVAATAAAPTGPVGAATSPVGPATRPLIATAFVAAAAARATVPAPAARATVPAPAARATVPTAAARPAVPAPAARATVPTTRTARTTVATTRTARATVPAPAARATVPTTRTARTTVATTRTARTTVPTTAARPAVPAPAAWTTVATTRTAWATVAAASAVPTWTASVVVSATATASLPRAVVPIRSSVVSHLTILAANRAHTKPLSPHPCRYSAFEDDSGALDGSAATQRETSSAKMMHPEQRSTAPARSETRAL
ncbi:hypothetical protein GCM10009841_18990 [Microlunatus panaciterrae]